MPPLDIELRQKTGRRVPNCNCVTRGYLLTQDGYRAEWQSWNLIPSMQELWIIGVTSALAAGMVLACARPSANFCITHGAGTHLLGVVGACATWLIIPTINMCLCAYPSSCTAPFRQVRELCSQDCYRIIRTPGRRGTPFGCDQGVWLGVLLHAWWGGGGGGGGLHGQLLGCFRTEGWFVPAPVPRSGGPASTFIHCVLCHSHLNKPAITAHAHVPCHTRCSQPNRLGQWVAAVNV